VLSSQIGGTQSSLQDLLSEGAGAGGEHRTSDVGEVVGYVRAMNHGRSAGHARPGSRAGNAECAKGIAGQVY